MPEKLAIGAEGEDVARLHEQLAARGFSLSPEEVSSKFFGPATRDAVRQYQTQHELEATGEVDETTAALLASPVPAPAPTVPTSPAAPPPVAAAAPQPSEF